MTNAAVGLYNRRGGSAAAAERTVYGRQAAVSEHLRQRARLPDLAWLVLVLVLQRPRE